MFHGPVVSSSANCPATMPDKNRGEMGGRAEAAFGRSVRQLRGERGLSQEQLAEISGCDRSYLSFVERGISSPSLDVIVKLAGAFKLAPSQLLERMESELARSDGSP